MNTVGKIFFLDCDAHCEVTYFMDDCYVMCFWLVVCRVLCAKV